MVPGTKLPLGSSTAAVASGGSGSAGVPLLNCAAAERYLQSQWSSLSQGTGLSSRAAALDARCFSASSRAVEDCRADVALFLDKVPASEAATVSVDVVRVEVVRLANHVPLPDVPSALVCGALSAVTSFPVAHALESMMGLRPRGSPHFGHSLASHGKEQLGRCCEGTTVWMNLVDIATEPLSLADVAAGESATAAAATTSAGPAAKDQGMRRPGCPGGLGRKFRLTVVVDLQSSELSFGSLDKTFLSNLSEYREATTSALVDCIRQLLDSQPTLLGVEAVDDVEKCAFEAMLAADLPNFSDALASLVTEIDEPATRACLTVLQVPSTHVHQPTLAEEFNTRIGAILRAAHAEQSEWTTGGRLRRNPRKRAAEEKADSENVGDPYVDLKTAELKDILRARGLKVLEMGLCVLL